MARKPTKSRRASKSDVKAASDRAAKRSRGGKSTKPQVDGDPFIVKSHELAKGVPVGRPTKYKPEFAAVARALCKRGATDYELALEFDVTTVTIWRWQGKYQDFCNALRVEKGSFDDRIERTLAQRALGYTYNSEKLFCYEGEVTRADVVEHVPPDVGAAKLWLTNRRPERWRDVTRQEHTGPDGGPIEMKSAADEINSRIARIAAREGASGGPRRDH